MAMMEPPPAYRDAPEILLLRAPGGRLSCSLHSMLQATSLVSLSQAVAAF